jgi:sulfate-transporting ATPase
LGKWLQFIGGLLLLITVVLNPDGIAGSLAQQLTPVTRRLRRFRARRPSFVLAPVDVNALVRHEPTLLSVRGLSVRFGSVVAVDDVTLDLRDGEVLGVIGPNGAGKTTLVDAITGYVASTGAVELDGRTISSLPAHQRSRAGITRSFQSLELFEELSVGENLMVASERNDAWDGLRVLFWPGRPVLDAAAAAVVQEFDLADKLDAAPASLSYAQRRLLGISRAVARHPRVLLLDEPAAGLDDSDRAELETLLRRLASTWKIAVLLIEHDVELVMSVSDRVIALEFGKIIAQGAPDVVRRDPEVVRAYLGVDDQLSASAAPPLGRAMPPDAGAGAREEVTT